MDICYLFCYQSLIINLFQKSFLLKNFQLIMHKTMYKCGANKVLSHKHGLYISLYSNITLLNA